jgi:hypothetical protein
VISPQEFVDKKVGPAAIWLDAARKNKELTMRSLMATLDELFDRATFYREPSIGECPTQEWDQRLHSAVQTLRLLEEYKPFVEAKAGPALERYRRLMTDVSKYCERMAAHLFDPIVGLGEFATLVGTHDFIPRVHSTKKFFPGGVDPTTCEKIDPYLQAANRQMKDLYRDFVGTSKLVTANAPGVVKPRIYISYSTHTKGAKQRISKLARKLRDAGIDARIDLFYKESWYGFISPPPRPGTKCMDSLAGRTNQKG